MRAHTIKFEYDNGVKLIKPILWCGEEARNEFMFMDAQHTALSVDGSIEPCKECIKAIIKRLEKEL